MLLSSRPFPITTVIRLFVVLTTINLLIIALPVQAQEANEAAAARDFNASAALQNSGFHTRAAEKWSAFISKYPQDKRLDAAHYYLGICQLHQKKYSDAIKTFETVLSRFPQFNRADGAQYNLAMGRYQLATASKQAADFSKAAEAFAQVPAKYPQSSHAHRALYFEGEAWYSAGNVERAIAAYQRLIKDHADGPLLAETYYALGTTQQERQEDERAAATYDAFLKNAALANHELATEIRLRLGLSQFNLKRFAEAESTLAQVVAVPDYELADFAMFRRAQCLAEQGKTAEAASRFLELPAKFSNSPYRAGAQMEAGKCLYQTDRLDDAAKQLKYAVDAKGAEAAEASYWLGRTLLKQGKNAEAFALLESASNQFSEGEFAPYLRIARLDAMYDLPDRREETPAQFDAFARQHPNHALAAHATYMAALAALDTGDYAAAARHADSFLGNSEFTGSDLTPEVLYISGEARLVETSTKGTGDLGKAESHYRQLIEKYPEHTRGPRSLVRIGWCLLQGKKYDDTVRHLNDSLNRLNNDAALKAEAYLLIGQAHAAASRDREAIAAYDESLKAKPDWSRRDEALAAVAQCLRAVGEKDKAVARLKDLLSQLPTSPLAAQSAYLCGEILAEEGKHDEAIPQFEKVINDYRDSQFAQPARYGLAAARFAKKDYSNARKSLDELLASSPDDSSKSRALYLRGLTFQRMDEPAAAVEDLRAFAATNPDGNDRFDARYAMALCQIQLKQFAPAAETLTAILKDKPDYARADQVRYELGHALLEQDRSDEAAAAFGDLVEKHPESSFVAESYFHIGRFHEQTATAIESESEKSAELDRAATAFAAGADKTDQAALREKLLYKLGDMQFQREDYTAAAATLQNQIDAYPDGELVGPGTFLAAESLFRSEKYAEALPLFVRVFERDIANYSDRSMYRAGTCAKNLSNWADSQKYFTELINKYPNFEQIDEARYGVGLALQNQNQLDSARKSFEQVPEGTEAAAKSRFMIGEIDFSEKKYEDAIESFLLVAVGYPYPEWQALARFEAGRCFVELDRIDKAIESLQMVIDKYPQHPRAKDAATLITQLKSR